MTASSSTTSTRPRGRLSADIPRGATLARTAPTRASQEILSAGTVFDRTAGLRSPPYGVFRTSAFGEDPVDAAHCLERASVASARSPAQGRRIFCTRRQIGRNAKHTHAAHHPIAATLVDRRGHRRRERRGALRERGPGPRRSGVDVHGGRGDEPGHRRDRHRRGHGHRWRDSDERRRELRIERAPA